MLSRGAFPESWRRLPVTAVALTRDDRTAFAVSKDGALVELDIETGTRQAAQG